MQLQRKALELLGKMESEGDYRGAIGASREARECLVSANELTAKAADGSGGIVVTVQHMGGTEIVTPTDSPPNQHRRDRQPTESAASQATLPSVSSVMEGESQPLAIAAAQTSPNW